MTEEKKDALKKAEDTMACSAFAEAGEPCPIDTGGEACKETAGKEKEKVDLAAVEKDFACSAFAEAGEPCPINNK